MRPILPFPAAFLALGLLALPVAAQQPAHSPYAHDASAEVKTLSAEEVRALLEGEGMGLARPAELNGFPGPRHVLDLVDPLELTAGQREEVQAVFDGMRRDAEARGRRVIEAERRLDSLFAAGEVEEDALAAAVESVARERAALRLAHLRAHLRTRDLMTRHQVHEYDRLRGYGSGHAHPGG